MFLLLPALLARVELASGVFRGTESFSLPNTSIISVFLPERALPSGSQLQTKTQILDLSGVPSFEVGGESFHVSVPSGSNIRFYQWLLPADLCQGTGYFLLADYKIKASTQFHAVSSMCFFVEPGRSGYMTTFTIQAPKPYAKVEYYINNTESPDVSCKSWSPNESLSCFAPYAQPFFVRVADVDDQDIKLKLEYATVPDNGNRTDQRGRGCDMMKIPGRAGSQNDVDLSVRRVCVEIETDQALLVVTVGFICLSLIIAGCVGHFLRICDFGQWWNVSTDIPLSPLKDGNIEETFDVTQEEERFSAAESETSSDIQELTL